MKNKTTIWSWFAIPGPIAEEMYVNIQLRYMYIHVLAALFILAKI
jgi:hypothetical protein